VQEEIYIMDHRNPGHVQLQERVFLEINLRFMRENQQSINAILVPKRTEKHERERWGKYKSMRYVQKSANDCHPSHPQPTYSNPLSVPSISIRLVPCCHDESEGEIVDYGVKIVDRERWENRVMPRKAELKPPLHWTFSIREGIFEMASGTRVQ
jgi:hypothetical protein